MAPKVTEQQPNGTSRRGFLRTIGIGAAIAAALTLPMKSLFGATKRTRAPEFPQDSMFRPREDQLKAMRQGRKLPTRKA